MSLSLLIRRLPTPRQIPNTQKYFWPTCLRLSLSTHSARHLEGPEEADSSNFHHGSTKFPCSTPDGLSWNAREALSKAKFRLSPDAARKLGASQRLRLATTGMREETSVSHQQRELMRLLDERLRHSDFQGLSCLALALLHIVDCTNHVGTSTGQVVYLDWQRRNKFGLRAVLRSGMAIVSISLKKFKFFKFRVGLGDHVGSETITRYNIRLAGTPIAVDHSKSTTVCATLATRDEAHFLINNVDLILASLSEAAVFASVEDILQAAAETLLRVLQFRSPFLRLDRIRLATEWFDESQPGEPRRETTVAQWKGAFEALQTANGLPAVVQSQLREVEVSMSRSHTDEHESKHLAIEEKEAQDKEDLEQEQRADESLSERLSPDQYHHLINTKKGNHIESRLTPYIRLHQVPQPATPHDIQFKFCCTWPVAKKSVIGDLTFDTVLRTFYRELETTSYTTLNGLWQIVRNIQKALPGTPSIKLSLDLSADALQSGIEADPGRSMRSFRLSADLRGPVHPPKVKICFPSRAFTLSQSSAQATNTHLQAHYLAMFAINLHALDEVAEHDIFTIADRLTAATDDTIARPLLEETSSTAELAQRCSAAIVDARHTLGKIIPFRRVRVKVTPEQGGKMLPASHSSGSVSSIAYIALGSNVGDRLGAIESACHIVKSDRSMRILETSQLYETDPMYLTNQGKFMNGVCKIQTTLTPMELLAKLQAIENELGRVKIIDKGPRNIDLDILLYGDHIIQTERLIVPHKLMLEREFVLRPLLDTSACSTPHPITGKPYTVHFKELPTSETPMYPLTPLAPDTEGIRSLDPKRRTLVMSILNVTPDSFSDGGDNQPTDIDKLKEIVASHIAAGTTIIDIGGQSSRPNALDIKAEEEIARILPAIEAIKSLPEASRIAISIDTYRAAVAEAAINAGAHIINDISAGLLDPEMLPTIARLGCTYIMMHMRGTPSTMQNERNTSYSNGLIPTIATELRCRVYAALGAGIYRWRIILDPGIGFAKTTEQNAQLLGKFSELRHANGLSTFPWLVGSSRKGFIGSLTGVTDAKDRVEGTAATVTAAVQGGAEIVRVHDVREMARVVRMADAMYRS